MEQRHSDQIVKVRQLLNDFDTAMLITHSTEQPYHCRPMAIAHVEDNCDLWFFTGRSSPKVTEIEHDERVLIACQDEQARYIALVGRAQLIANPDKAREFWKESFRAWFPGGINDPDLLLIRVRAEKAEYWDTHGAKGIKYLFKAAAAYSMGTRPNVEEGEQHGTVVL